MSGIIEATNIQTENIKHTNGTTAATVSSGGVLYSAGHVLNVLQATTDTKGSAIASGNNSDVISQAITPRSTSSKILVRCVIHIGGDNNSYGYGKLLRDSTAIGVATTASGSQINASFQVQTKNWTYQSYRTSPHPFEFLDSPNTTGSITYKINLACTSGNIFLNRAGTDSTSDAFTPTVVSTLTLMEIGG